MNLTVLLIAAYLPLPIILFMILRSGSFGKGSIGTMLKLFFFGVAAAVPAFLMEAGCLLVINILLGLFPDGAFGGNMPIVSAVLRYFIAAALIEEGWKLFVLHASTWKQMIMENIPDGIAASALVGTGFSAVMYGAWQAAYYVVPADMDAVRRAMPDFLGAGPVIAFLFALLYIFSHFGFSGIMGAFYGIAKGSEQKEHGKRAGFMLFVSGLLPIFLHGFCMTLIGYGISEEKTLWVVIGLALEVILALLMVMMLSRASDADGNDTSFGTENQPVDFADSEEFADFAEAAGNPDGTEAVEAADPADSYGEQDAALSYGTEAPAGNQDAAFSYESADPAADQNAALSSEAADPGNRGDMF